MQSSGQARSWHITYLLNTTLKASDIMALFLFQPHETSHVNRLSHKLLDILLKPTTGKHVYLVFKHLM